MYMEVEVLHLSVAYNEQCLSAGWHAIASLSPTCFPLDKNHCFFQPSLQDSILHYEFAITYLDH